MYQDICKLLGIKYPIFQGAMTYVTDKNMVAAVSEAGGLGIFAPGDDAAKEGGEWLREQIRTLREMTEKPFGVNLAMRSSKIEELVQVICEEHVTLVTTGGGNPAPYIPQLKEAGVLVAPVVPDAKVAVKMQNAGADLVVASGMEAGGFVGTVTTMVTLPQVVSAVTIPVIAAGGIADGIGMAAAFAMGASGVQMGTRFMLSRECTIPEAVKEAMLAMASKDAVALPSRLHAGPHLRVMNNEAVRTIIAYADEEGATLEKYTELFNAGRAEDLLRQAETEKAFLPVGEIVGAIDRILSVEEILTGIMREYREAVQNMPNM